MVFADTWDFNTGTLTWTDATPTQVCHSLGGGSVCPAGRHDAMMTYDNTAGFTVLFGGCSTINPSGIQGTPGCDNSHLLRDTWKLVWGAGVATWTQLFSASSCTGTTCPSARYASSFSWDLADGTDVLFGGCAVAPTSCPLQDTWVFTGSVATWTHILPSTSPSARYGAPFANGQAPPFTGGFNLVLFGGCTTSGTGCVPGAVGDTWLYATGVWNQYTVPAGCPATPPPRYYHQFSAYQGPGWTGVDMLFGGLDAFDHELGDWWVWPAPFGTASGCWVQTTAPGGWTPGASPIATLNSAPPDPRDDAVDVQIDVGNPATGCDGLFLFGGTSASGASFGDTWFSGVAPFCTGYSARLWPAESPTSSRFFGAMASDGTDVVFFGGCGAVCPGQDTWVWAYDGTPNVGYAHWIHYYGGSNAPCTGTTCPSKRIGLSLAYDAYDGYFILFGGQDATGAFLQDTWTLTYSSTVHNGWVLRSPTTSPSPRTGSAMVFDALAADQYVVLFGGYGCTNPPSCSLIGNLQDTWQWVGGASPTWSSITTTGVPASRSYAAITYDGTDNYVLLFGGCGATCPLSDTWTYASGAWSQKLPTTVPPARQHAMLTYDSGDGYALMFGGCGTPSPVQGCALGDTWKYKAGGWTQLTLSPSPSATSSGAMAYDSNDGYAVLFGGTEIIMGGSQCCLSGITWGYSAGAWVSDLPHGQIASYQSPSPRSAFGMAYLPSQNEVVAVDGDGCGSNWGGVECYDTWTFFGGSWKLFCAGCGPTDLVASPSFAYDAAGGYLLFFGGVCPIVCSTGVHYSQATWRFDGSSWLQLHPATSPNARADASMAYDTPDGYTLLFGGYGCLSAPPACTSLGVMRETWKWTAATSTWALLSTTTGPGARAGGSMTYDSGSGTGYVLFFGGWGCATTAACGTPAYQSDTWKYKTGWTKLGPATIPAVRADASMAYDATDGFVIMFGGMTTGPALLGDTWKYTSAGWTLLTPAVAPSARANAGMAYVPVVGPGGFVILFGGSFALIPGWMAPSGNPQADTWSYDFGAWTYLSDWT